MNPNGSLIHFPLPHQPGHFPDRTGAGHKNQQSSGQNPNAAQVYRTMDNHNVSYSAQSAANPVPDLGLVASNLGAPFVPTTGQLLEAFFMIGQQLFTKFQDQSCVNGTNLGFIKQNPIPQRIETKMYTADEVQACLDHQSSTFRDNFLSLLGKTSVNTEAAQVSDSVRTKKVANNLGTKGDYQVTSSPQYKTGKVNLAHVISQKGTWTEEVHNTIVATHAFDKKAFRSVATPNNRLKRTRHRCHWCGKRGHYKTECYNWQNQHPPSTTYKWITEEWLHLNNLPKHTLLKSDKDLAIDRLQKELLAKCGY